MDFTVAISFLTTIVSVCVKVVGLPDQIKSNHQRKSTAGLSSWFVLSAFISYILWTIHGIQVHDDALIIGQGLGVLATSVIVWQVYIYRANKAKVTVSSEQGGKGIGNRVGKPRNWVLKTKRNSTQGLTDN